MFLAAPATDRAAGDQLPAMPRAVRVFSWADPHPACSEIVPLIWADVGARLDVRALAERSRQAPSGCAAFLLWHGADPLYQHPDDFLRGADGKATKIPSPWPAHAIAERRRAMLEFWEALKAAGGRVDYVALNYETFPHIESFEQPEWFQALRDDPAGQRLLRRVARYPAGVAPPDGGDAASNEAAAAPAKFGTVRDMMVFFVHSAMDQAVFEPLFRVFPNAAGSNFNSFQVTPDNPTLDLNGWVSDGLPMAGNRSAPAAYGDIHNLGVVWLSDPRLMNGPVADDRPYGRHPFDALRYYVNTIRAIGRSRKLPIDPWIANADYQAVFYRNSFYDELIYHLALAGSDTLLCFNPRGEAASEDGDLLPNACVATINRLMGGERRGATIMTPIPWNSELVVSGQEIGDHILWRITSSKPSLNVRVEPTGEVLEMGGGVGRWYVSAPNPKLKFVIAR